MCLCMFQEGEDVVNVGSVYFYSDGDAEQEWGGGGVKSRKAVLSYFNDVERIGKNIDISININYCP